MLDPTVPAAGPTSTRQIVGSPDQLQRFPEAVRLLDRPAIGLNQTQSAGADRPRRSQNHRRHWHRCTSGWDLPAVLTLTLVVERPWQPHHAGQIVRSAFATYNDAGIRRPGTVPGCPGSVPATALGDHQLLSIQHVGSYDSGLYSGPIQSGG